MSINLSPTGSDRYSPVVSLDNLAAVRRRRGRVAGADALDCCVEITKQRPGNQSDALCGLAVLLICVERLPPRLGISSETLPLRGGHVFARSLLDLRRA